MTSFFFFERLQNWLFIFIHTRQVIWCFREQKVCLIIDWKPTLIRKDAWTRPLTLEHSLNIEIACAISWGVFLCWHGTVCFHVRTCLHEHTHKLYFCFCVQTHAMNSKAVIIVQYTQKKRDHCCRAWTAWTLTASEREALGKMKLMQLSMALLADWRC